MFAKPPRHGGVVAWYVYNIPGGGVPRFGLDGGVPLDPQNPYTFLRVILAERGTNFQGFFSKYRSTFHNFWVFVIPVWLDICGEYPPNNIAYVHWSDEHLLYLALYWRHQFYISAGLLILAINIWLVWKNYCAIIIMHLANEWMWTPNLGILQFECGDTPVMEIIELS